MVKGRKEEIFVAFLDIEKAYDRVNRKKLFEVMICYGVHEKLVRLIDIIYDGSMVKFVVTTPFQHICQGIRKGDNRLCTWSQICSGGKGWCHGMEESSRTSICR